MVNSDITDKNPINLLQEIQDRDGYIDAKEMVSLAKRMGVPGVNLYGVATFYAQFKLKKPGKYKVSVCTGTACHVKNSASLLSDLEEYLEIKPGETTKNGKITLETVNCIGACAKAPAMRINNIVYGELTKEKVKKIIESLP